MNALFDKMIQDDFEQVLFCHDEICGLKGIIVIHDTTLGPAMGGVRMHPYASEEEALDDVFKISRAMTLKAAAAGLNLGGGSAVILGDPKTAKNEALLRSFGRHVESLCGRLIVAEDVGITVEDIETVGLETNWIAGFGKSFGGGGTPALKAALGVFRGIQACCKQAFQDPNLRDRVIAVQGLGAVGFELARLVAEEGARLKVADKDPRKIERFQKLFDVEVLAPEAILTASCDVFSPCALGGIIGENEVPTLQAKIIAGSANNQLVSDKVGEMLFRKGILYAPDFVINSGGLINAAEELQGYDETRANSKVSRIFNEIEAILQISHDRGIPTDVAANEKAMERIRVIRQVRRTYLPTEK